MTKTSSTRSITNVTLASHPGLDGLTLAQREPGTLATELHSTTPARRAQLGQGLTTVKAVAVTPHAKKQPLNLHAAGTRLRQNGSDPKDEVENTSHFEW